MLKILAPVQMRTTSTALCCSFCLSVCLCVCLYVCLYLSLDPGWNAGETCWRKEPVHTVRGGVFCAGSTDTHFCTIPRGPTDRCPRTARMSAGTVGGLLLSLLVVVMSQWLCRTGHVVLAMAVLTAVLFPQGCLHVL